MQLAYVIAICSATTTVPVDCRVETIYEKRADCFAAKKLLNVAVAIGRLRHGERIECQVRQFVKMNKS